MNDIFSKEFDDNITNMVERMFEETEKNLEPNNIEENMYLNSLLAEYFRKVGKSPEQYSSTIPASFDLLDTNTKIKILVECFDNECVIEKSKTYNSSIEGSFTPNFYQDPNKIK